MLGFCPVSEVAGHGSATEGCDLKPALQEPAPGLSTNCVAFFLHLGSKQGSPSTQPRVPENPSAPGTGQDPGARDKKGASSDPLGRADLRTGGTLEEKYLVISPVPLCVNGTHGPLMVKEPASGLS